MAGLSFYRDGAYDSDSPDGTGTITRQFFVGGLNETGTVPSPWSFLDGKIQAIAIYSTTLDAAQVAQLSAAMAAL